MKKTILIAVAAIVITLLGIGLLIFLGYKGISNRPPTEEERSMMISFDVLEPFGYTNLPRQVGETWSAKVNIDGSTELEYEYDSDRAGDTNFLYLTADVSLDSTELEAQESFKLAVGAYKIGLKIGGATAEEKPELITLGDENYSALIRVDDEPMGNIVLVRHGRIIHSLLIMGLYFEEQIDLEGLFLQALENADPEKFGIPE